jgi:hypothetical protein
MNKHLIIGIAIIVATIAAVCGAIWGVLIWLSSVDVGLAGAVITAAAGITGLLFSQWHAKGREISEGHRPQKIEVYNTFFDIVERFMRNERNNKNETGIPKELQKKFEKLNRGMIIWASPGAIKAWLNFRRGSQDPDQKTLMLVDDILREIRKDLGNSNWRLKKGDAVRIYLKDVDELETTTQNLTNQDSQ